MEVNNMNTHSRRAFLGGIVSTTTVAVAGCSSGQGDSPSSEAGAGGGETDQNSPFGEMQFDGFDLEVGLDTTDGFNQVVVYDPDGEEMGSAEVSAGSRQVSFGFEGYTAGDHRIAAINTEDDSVVAESVRGFTPELELERFEAQDSDEVGEDNPYGRATVEISNAGTGPTSVEWLGLEAESIKTYDDPEYIKKTSGDNGPDLVDHEYPIPIPAQGSVTISTLRNTLSNQWGSDLPREEKTIDLTLTLGTVHGEEEFNRQLEFINTSHQYAYEPSEAEVNIKNGTEE